MARSFVTSKEDWDIVLSELLPEYDLYAPVAEEGSQDYIPVDTQDIPAISYNIPKPTSPLKTFFLPVKEKVSGEVAMARPRIILGVPACDLKGLDLLDRIYLDEAFPDPFYQLKRENTLLIGTDCHSYQEHCHCVSYGVYPFPVDHADLALALVDGQVFLQALSDKGTRFAESLLKKGKVKETGDREAGRMMELREKTKSELKKKNKDLPGYERTGVLIKKSGDGVWEKYAKDCVSCGACATICPTCTCFLLIDQPDFDKVKQMDACQYPGFERVAAGEDPLREKMVRFRNRYLCKYVWKPETFHVMACTGCGRCIEACIGRINKNELFLEMTV